MTKLIFGKEVEKIAKTLKKEMPVLSFIIWDMTPFIPYMHNWRKNIIFIECDRVAVDLLAERLAREYGTYDIYSGIKKPVIKTTRSEKEATIVIIAREGRLRREVEGIHPKIEKCLVDLLYYSKNEILPISFKDIIDLWEYFLTSTDLIRFNELYRYSVRRYLGWFVSILAYKISKKIKLPIDSRHFNQGMKILELVQMVSSSRK